MIKIINGNTEKELHTDNYTLVSDLIRESAFSMPCGGKGTCLKCKVIIKGDASPLSELEEKALSDEEKKQGVRLACRAMIKSGEIILGNNFISNILTKGTAKFNKGEKAVAVDIGTTTIAAYYFNGRETEKEISEVNKLTSFGADVMSRIEYSIKNSFEEMHLILINQVDSIIDRLTIKETRIVVTGNTVMLHIYAGYSIEKMGKFPYTPESLFGKEVTIKDKKIYLPTCVSAFVGADLYCALIASGIYKNERGLLIDLGTNGEIALKNKYKITVTSVSAGPAFEGVGLSCGVGAIDGAISSVFAQGTNLKFSTVNKKEPSGICGSGIIDFIAVLKKYRVIDENGVISNEGHPFTHLIKECETGLKIYLSGTDIYITQSDIRNIQLAKSAVISGIETLLKEEELTYDEIDSLYISGGFGNYININNAAFINLIPEKLKDKVILIGNGAGMGALMIATDNYDDKAFEYKNIDLSDNAFFNEEFIKNINL